MGQLQPPADVLPVVGVLASPDCAAAEWEAALGTLAVFGFLVLRAMMF